ncbi:MFS general substrate transporter [Imleria badia]|nr:MFS general substrate transporter [Imleria badia]
MIARLSNQTLHRPRKVPNSGLSSLPCVPAFLSLPSELSSASTALPTLANALHASQFTWVGSAYALASTAFLPMSGGLAQTFGRRPAILLTIGLFALGSGICGGATSMNMLIAGRTIQGFGGGGIRSLTGIILADLVTLQERARGVFLRRLVLSLGVASRRTDSGIGFSNIWDTQRIFKTSIFPFRSLRVSVVFLLDLPTPPGSYREKIMRMDWITAAYTIRLAWGGITAPWGSVAVLVPLILGLVGLGVFIVYDATLAKQSLTFCSTVITLAVVYYFPLYFQACKGASPVLCGIYSLAFASLAPAAILTGLSVKPIGRYRPQMWIGWTFTVIALGLMSTILATDPLSKSFGYVALFGWGIGALLVTQNTPALAFMWFLRSFASVWGITIGSTVLQNELAKKLPASFIRSVPQGTAIMYALIPELSMLPPQTRFEVQVAFSGCLAVLWRVLAVVSGVGLVVSLFMKGLPLHTTLDADWALKNGKEDHSI